jgi:hypothetical protein
MKTIFGSFGVALPPSPSWHTINDFRRTPFLMMDQNQYQLRRDKCRKICSNARTTTKGPVQNSPLKEIRIWGIQTDGFDYVVKMNGQPVEADGDEDDDALKLGALPRRDFRE